MNKKSAKRRTFGAIRKLPSGRYQASYKDSFGNRHTAPQTFISKSDADRWLAGMQTDMTRGTWINPELGLMTFGEYLQRWLASPPRPLRATTREQYEYLAQRFFTASAGRIHLETVELAAISPMLIREWHAQALKAAASRQPQSKPLRPEQAARLWARAHGIATPRTGRLSAALVAQWQAAGCPLPAAKTLSPDRGRTMTAQAYRLLKAVLNTAVSEGLIAANPCRIAGAGSVKADERVPATAAQLAALADAVPARYRAAVLLAGWLGLRAGELFGLARRHVNTELSTVTVERQLARSPKLGMFLTQPKTERSKRTVTVPQSVMAELELHMQRFVGSDSEALLFTTSEGNFVPSARRTDMLKAALREVGMPSNFRWHDLRHTGQTLAAHTGASLQQLMSRMGHSTPRMAMHYMHAAADADRELAAKLDEVARATASVASLDQHRSLKRSAS